VRAALDAHAMSRLAEVDDALRRLDAGAYGQCGSSRWGGE
jgi:RNA polymerase-binding transcription factor DksA